MNRTPLMLLLILVPCIACRRAEFEQKQFEAEAANPHWLQIDLDTVDGRHTYKESELIAFKVSYSSAVRELYKAEVGEDWSAIVFTDKIHVSNGIVSSMRIYGIVCCGSRTIGLNDEPYVTRPQLRLHLKPGVYQMYMTTKRVFPWNITPQVYEPSEWTTASNMLEILVVPDLGWQERALQRSASTPKAKVPCWDLSILDIPAATERKLEQIRDHDPCGSHSSFPEFNESEYPAALRGMEGLLHSPTYGVTQFDVNVILAMRSWMAHPDQRNAPEDAQEQERLGLRQHDLFLDDEKAFVRELCDTLPIKLADAKTTTQHTIDGLTANKRAGIPTCK